MHRWADENQTQDRSVLRKKMAKIEELSNAKAVGLARLEATKVLAKQLESETHPNGYELISAEMKSQEAQWEEWLETLIEAEANISTTLRELEEYQDGFREETDKIHEILREFQTETDS